MALTYVKETVNEIPRKALGPELAEEVEEGEPVNFLLVGADSIANLPEDHPLRNTRGENLLLTDTLIVMRLDPETGTMSALSIPRDLYVPISGFGSEERINTALALGDSGTLLRTVQDYFDIPIHYYVQVDFNGFLELIDLMGGINVWVEHAVRDPKAQLEISETGCVNLSPEQALGYVRSRTMEALVDGSWVRIDGRSDLGRIERQQEFLVAVLRRAIAKGARNPFTLNDMLKAGAKSVSLDDRLTLDDLQTYGEQFRDMRPEELQRYSLPLYDDQVGSEEDGTLQLILRLVADEAQPVLNVFRGAADQQSFRVTVYNGNGATRGAGNAADELTLAGFEVAAALDADRSDYSRTIIRYVPSQADRAQLLGSWLVNGAELQEIAESDGTVQLIVGQDFAGVRSEAGPVPALPTAPLPEPAQPGDDEPPVLDSSEPVPLPVATPVADAAPLPGEIEPISVTDTRCG